MKKIKVLYAATSITPFIKKHIETLKKSRRLDTSVCTMDGLFEKYGGIIPAISSLKGKITFFVATIFFLIRIAYFGMKNNVIIANWSYTAFLAVISRSIHHAKIVTIERSPDLVSLRGGLLHDLILFAYKKSDRVVTISKYAKDKIMANYGDLNIEVVYNGVDIQRYHAKKRNKIFNLLYVGRLVKIKNVEALLNIMPDLNYCSNNFFLNIVGDGSLYDELRRKASYCDNVRFWGRVKHKDVFDLMKKCDAFVYPSNDDTGANVLLEAMSCGIPIITKNVGYASDLLVNGVNALICKDEQDFLRSIVKLYNSNLDIEKLRRNAYETVKNITWSENRKRYEEMIKEVCNES